MVNRKDDDIIEEENKPNWKCHLSMYKDTIALKFQSNEDLKAAIDLLFTDVLYGMPNASVDYDTFIVPAEAEKYFSGLRYTSSRVLLASELPPEEITELRREQGPF